MIFPHIYIPTYIRKFHENFSDIRLWWYSELIYYCLQFEIKCVLIIQSCIFFNVCIYKRCQNHISNIVLHLFDSFVYHFVLDFKLDSSKSCWPFIILWNESLQYILASTERTSGCSFCMLCCLIQKSCCICMWCLKSSRLCWILGFKMRTANQLLFLSEKFSWGSRESHHLEYFSL